MCCPGLSLIATIGIGPIRGLYTHKTGTEDFYVVSGNEVYKMTSLTSTPQLLGTVNGYGPVSIADNGTQVIFVCNPDAFIYNEPAGTFAKVTDPNYPGGVTVSYLDGYFIVNQPNTQKFYVSALLDGTTWNALDFASAEGSPDNISSLIVDHRELWLFGTNSIEVWYNAGLQDFPMSRIQGAFIEIGCTAPYSIAKLDNSLFWLGSDARGNGIVYRANGYSGQRISTNALEFAIQGYSVINDAIAYSYQQEGHSFYMLIFPTADKTWCYDVSTNVWHQRAGFSNGNFTRHRSNCQISFQNEIILGDYQNGNIYAFDLNTYADNNQTQKWLRSWRALPTGANDLKRIAHHSLQLDCEAGSGLITGQGSDPQVLLRWSDDGGHTWSNYHSRSMGKIGEYGRRVIWYRLGMTTKLRDRIYEISGSDPIKISIMGASINASGTTS